MRQGAAFLILVAAVVVSACATKTVPTPVVVAPTYPDFIKPPVPPALAGTMAAAAFERAWRFLQSNDLKSADREAGAALQASPGFFPADATSGYIALARKDPKAALAHFDRTLEKQTGYVSALVGRGRALQSLERDDEAIAAYEAAVALDPSLTDLPRQVDVLRFRGTEREIARARLAARGNRVAEAREAYRRAIVASPDSAFLYRELAQLERQAGEPEAAIAQLRKAVELEPSDAASLGQIGEILEARGDVDGALSAYAEALTLEPNERLAARREDLLARVELSRLPEEYRTIDTTEQITRAQLAALIAIRLADRLESFPRSEPGVLTDIRGSWAERWIMAVARAGIMEPFANHTFQPRAVVRRADLAPIASRLVVRLSEPQQARSWQAARTTFTDLSPGHLAYPAASTAVASGVMRPSADGAFRPNEAVSGTEAIAVVDGIQRLFGVRKPAVRAR